jgi:hypothetical protein
MKHLNKTAWAKNSNTIQTIKVRAACSSPSQILTEIITAGIENSVANEKYLTRFRMFGI